MIKRTKMGSIRFPEGGQGPFEGNASAEPPPDLAASQGIPINPCPFKKDPRFPFQFKSGLEALRGDSAEPPPPPPARDPPFHRNCACRRRGRSYGCNMAQSPKDVSFRRQINRRAASLFVRT